MTTPTPPPGWHPDPEGTPQLRWWDGTQWTSATKPRALQEGPKTPPSPIDPAIRRRNNLIAAGLIGIVVLGLGAWQILNTQGGGNGPAASEAAAIASSPSVASRASAPTASAAPTSSANATTDEVMRAFWLRVDREGYLTINVNGTYTDQELESAFLEVRRTYTSTKKTGGWHVFIDCGDGQQAVGGARQANGKFALDSLGAARTGLAVGQYEFEPLPNRNACPPDLPTIAAGTVTAHDVIAAFVAAGLPATNRQDRTITAGCEDLKCAQMIAVDEVSVYLFSDVAHAAHYAEIFGANKVYQNGLLAIRYKRDGKHPIDEALIPQYNAALDAVGSVR